MKKIGSLLFALAALTPFCLAVETKSWVHNEQADFEKGTLNKLSLRSDGRLMLAPQFKELLDSTAPYLWALAEDASGNLYAGGGGSGSTSKLYKIDANGKSSTLAEIPGMEIHAIAIDGAGVVYAATAPDGKVYRINAGKAEVFYDPKAKYIWSIAFDSKGNLYVATGDQGEIHRVSANGQGSVFFKTEETHARSMAIDAAGNLIVGTEPGGLILRITPGGDGFVLHQASKREITAVAVAKDGSIYASGVGTRGAGTTSTPQSISIPIPQVPTTGGRGNITLSAGGPPPAAIVSTPSAPPAISGGSEVYRIEKDGFSRRIWSHPTDIVYTIAFDAQGHPILGTGNKGHIHRLDSGHTSTLLITAQPTQITNLLAGSGGKIYAATGNIGKVFQVGPELEKQGSYESEAMDAAFFSYWGRISWKGQGVRLETRSGNLDRPQKNWSPWAPADLKNGSRITSPSARFVQYRASLDGANAELYQLELAYMQKNVPPVLYEIEVTPSNYKFPAPAVNLTPTPSITLPPLGQHRKAPSAGLDTGSSSQNMPYAKGYIGVRWTASDPNGDELLYKVEIKGTKETDWKLLKDKVRERYLSWDSTAFPDGEYRIRVSATDAPGNPPAQALTASIESDQFLIDNTPPQVTGLSATRNGNTITVKWSAKDALSVLDKAEYSVDGKEWTLVEPTTRLSDAPEHSYVLTLNDASAGEHTIAVRVADENDNQCVEKTVVR